jgi:hypothetical protein
MPSPDIYVQVTITPHDRQSGRPSDSPQTAIVEVPGTRIERYREQSPYAGEATNEQLAEYLAGEIGPHALARAGLHRSGRWCGWADSRAFGARHLNIAVVKRISAGRGSV